MNNVLLCGKGTSKVGIQTTSITFSIDPENFMQLYWNLAKFWWKNCVHFRVREIHQAESAAVRPGPVAQLVRPGWKWKMLNLLHIAPQNPYKCYIFWIGDDQVYVPAKFQANPLRIVAVGPEKRSLLTLAHCLTRNVKIEKFTMLGKLNVHKRYMYEKHYIPRVCHWNFSSK